MIQHYQKLHSDSDLVRTKEDLLLYIPDELENELVIDVKNNFNAGIEVCGQFSNNSDTIGKVSLAMEYRRVLCAKLMDITDAPWKNKHIVSYNQQLRSVSFYCPKFIIF